MVGWVETFWWRKEVTSTALCGEGERAQSSHQYIRLPVFWCTGVVYYCGDCERAQSSSHWGPRPFTSSLVTAELGINLIYYKRPFQLLKKSFVLADGGLPYQKDASI